MATVSHNPLDPYAPRALLPAGTIEAAGFPALGTAGRNRRLLAFSGVLLLFLAQLLRAQADPDLWGHLTFGLTAWHDGTLARTDPYSYTAQGAAWTNHEWLTELSFGIAYDWAGAVGLMCLRGTLLLTTAVGVVMLLRRRNVPLPALIVMGMLAVTVIPEFYRVRPQMYTYTLMTWLLVICTSYRPQRQWPLLFVPLMMIVWTNLHAGFVAGLGVFGLYWLEFMVGAWGTNRRVDGPCLRRWRYLLFILVAAWLATLINPYGIEYWKYVIYAVRLPRPEITEWRPIWQQNWMIIGFYGLAMVLPTVVWLGSTRRKAWAETAVFLLVAYLAAKHGRHMPFLYLCGMLIVARRLPECLRRYDEPATVDAKRSRVLKKVAFALLVVYCFVGGAAKLYHHMSTIAQHGPLSVPTTRYPVAAVAFLNDCEISGNLDCGFSWGEYCIYKLYPRCLVYCDGRFETVYPHEISTLALASANDTGQFERRLRDFPTQIVLAALADPFGEYVAQQPDFELIYADDVARIFVHRDILKEREHETEGSHRRLPSAVPFPA
ncbi:MAG: hypothetical protein R3E01_24110 [Pirellulaceae bacterium]|nr:hypothetical protein [Planctomycetales bacterium]